MKRFILFLIALFVFTGCKSESTETESTEEAAAEGEEQEEGTTEEGATEEAAAPEEEAAPAAPGAITLETATLPTMGHTMLLPAGFSRDRETETGAGYSYDLGNFRNILVSLEPQGVATADEARMYGSIVAGGLRVSEVIDAGNGRYTVLFNTREHDNMQGVAVFTPTHYVKCMAPAEHLDTLRQMCESLTPIP